VNDLVPSHETETRRSAGGLINAKANRILAPSGDRAADVLATH
jgi:hypothetical protein